MLTTLFTINLDENVKFILNVLQRNMKQIENKSFRPELKALLLFHTIPLVHGIPYNELNAYIFLMSVNFQEFRFQLECARAQQ